MKRRILIFILIVCSFQANATIDLVDFTSTNLCEGAQTVLADNSTVSGGVTITNWDWDLDNDGQFDDASGQVIGYQFNSAGTFVVGLRITASDNETGQTTHVVTINPMPIASFAATDICLGDQTTLSSTSTITSGSIVDFDWELNGNNFFDDASGQLITNQFVADGSYQIGLQVASDQGCTSNVFQLLTIAPYPFVGFTNLGSCQNAAIEFTNLTNNIVGSISYEWTFGFEGSSTDVDPVFTFNNAGAAQVQLIGTTSFGCADTLIQTIPVNPTPVANFTFTEACLGEATILTSITDPQGSTVQTEYWDFGDNNVAAGSNQLHTYGLTGSYTVMLMVFTTDNCSDTIQHDVPVWGLPAPWITAGGPLQFCEGDSVALSVTPIGEQIYWSTGEWTQSIVVDTTGTYEVTITDVHGCEGSADVSVEDMLLPPIAGFDFVTWWNQVDFANQSSMADSFFWEFGDDSTSVEVSPSHTYQSSGTYNVTLTAYNECGEISVSDSVSIVIAGIETDENFPLVIFPNPSDGQFTIEGNSSKGYNVEAFNSLGQPVFSTQFNSTDKISIELPTAGIYHLVVRTDEMIYTEKVVVQ